MSFDSRVYIMWFRLFSTAVIPVALLLYFNSRIFIDLLNSKVIISSLIDDTTFIRPGGPRANISLPPGNQKKCDLIDSNQQQKKTRKCFI